MFLAINLQSKSQNTSLSFYFSMIQLSFIKLLLNKTISKPQENHYLSQNIFHIFHHWILNLRITYSISLDLFRLSGWVVKWSESYHKGRRFDSPRWEKLSSKTYTSNNPCVTPSRFPVLKKIQKHTGNIPNLHLSFMMKHRTYW